MFIAASPTTRNRSIKLRLAAALLFALISPVLTQGTGHLQIHFMDVGQGDGALLITPGGQTVLFDNGVLNQCSRPLTYLASQGISKIDYHIASHYHADHIGCTEEVLSAFPLQHLALDRGGSYTTQTYNRYVAAVSAKRYTVPVGSSLPLDAGVSLDFVAANGNGVLGSDDENDLSVAVRVRYGAFEAMLAGDLSGVTDSGYVDVESSVAPLVGQVEVYKVNHHASRYSSNATWLGILQPKVGIVSVGTSNSFGHPTVEAMSRLHAANVTTYWTSDGNGVAPDPARDFIAGHIVIDVPPGSSTFTVSAAGLTHAYAMWGAQGAPPGPPENLTGSVDGTTVTLTWQAPTTGGPATSYVLEASATPGGPLIASASVANTILTVPGVANGTYYVRARAANGDGQSAPSNEIVIVVPSGGCSTAPSAPGTLSGTVNGSLVTLNWGAPVGGCAPTSYSLQAGSAPGLTDIAALNVGLQTGFGGSAPPGTYWVRVVAANAYGVSPPSNEIALTVVGGCTSPPNAPSGLTGNVSGTTVNLNWNPSVGGCEPTNYAVHAGSAPGLSDIAIANMGLQTSLSTGAPSGTYYVRVVATNAFGGSAPSNEVVLTVTCPLPGAPMLLSPGVSGSTVTLNWVSPGGTVTGYRVEAGSSSGGSNLLNAITGATSYTWSGAPAGTSYIRVRALNSCGVGPASNQVTATVSGGNPICGPTTAPCGQATARCNDGTYSCSQNRSGTCSSHGGVYCWICPGLLCSGDQRSSRDDAERQFSLWEGDRCGS